MKLPNGEKAVVDIAKLRDYSLNAQHEGGSHKARVFRSALGIDTDDAEWLREQLLEIAREGEAVEVAASVFGRRFNIDFVLIRGEKSVTIRSSWIVEYGTDFPRLTTCYVKGK